MTAYLDSDGLTYAEILELAKPEWWEDLTGIDELMPIFSGLIRMGRADLALPIYERLLPKLEDAVSFVYAHIPQWMAWTEQQAKDKAGGGAG